MLTQRVNGTELMINNQHTNIMKLCYETMQKLGVVIGDDGEILLKGSGNFLLGKLDWIKEWYNQYEEGGSQWIDDHLEEFGKAADLDCELFIIRRFNNAKINRIINIIKVFMVKLHDYLNRVNQVTIGDLNCEYVGVLQQNRDENEEIEDEDDENAGNNRSYRGHRPRSISGNSFSISHTE